MENNFSDGNSAKATEIKGYFDIKCELFDWAEALVTALSLIVLVFALVVRLIGVVGSSMYPTLNEGDQLIISNLFYEHPKQNDIVVLTKENFMEEPIIKRIIAVEGQTIDINFHTHEVSVDGVILDEPYIAELTERAEGMVFPQKVPEGCVFVMGDNRNNSTDSRDLRIGMVDNRYILGRVLLRVYPFSKFGNVYTND